MYGGDLRTGKGDIIVPPQDGRITVGLAMAPPSKAIFVAGGGPFLGSIPGSAYLHNAEAGAELAEYLLDGLFINR